MRTEVAHSRDPPAAMVPGRPLRILMLHNRYREAGGEERAVSEQIALLRAHGHTVELLEPSSSDLEGFSGRVRAARGMLRGGTLSARVAETAGELRADVVHAHNLHPLLGAGALEAARGLGARTVLQLHNFRLFCAIGVAYRDGRVCHRCHGRDTRPGLRLRCRGPIGESAVYAAGLSLQLPRLLAATGRFIALSEATRARLGRLGLPLELTEVVANPLRPEAFAAGAEPERGGYALCVGRLSSEKGFEVAVGAARAAEVPLRIAGEGPEREHLLDLAGAADVQLLGRVEGPELERLRRGAAVLLAPSRCEEQSPYAVLEAMAAGLPVLGSDRGGIPELVGAANAISPDDREGWRTGLEELWADPAERRRRGQEARERARERTAPARVHEALMRVYARAGGWVGPVGS